MTSLYCQPMEKQYKSRFTLRISKEILGKLGYIADYNGRTKNKELEQMIKGRISAFEKKVGEIPIVDEE